MLAVASALRPGVSVAAQTASQAAPDLAGFDREFRVGQEAFDRKQYHEAARIWLGAADLLPETEEHRENRRAIFEYIAETYEKAIDGGAGEDVMREGLAALDAYARAFSAAHPTASPPEHVTTTRLRFRTELDEREAALRRAAAVELARSVVVPEVVLPPPKPWKGLAVGGSVAVVGGAAMLGLFAVGFAGAKSSEAEFDDPANACDLDAPAGKCIHINDRGNAANSMAVAGLVTAPVLLGTGVALLVLASRRKAASRTAMAPIFSPTMAGLVWQRRF